MKDNPDPQVVVDALRYRPMSLGAKEAAERALPHAEALAARIEELERVAEAARRAHGWLASPIPAPYTALDELRAALYARRLSEEAGG